MLSQRPAPGQKLSACFKKEEGRPLELDAEVVVKQLFLSVDPYMRGRLYDKPSYAPPHPLGATMLGETIGQVIASKSSAVPIGSLVRAQGGWQTHASFKASDVELLETLPGSTPPYVHMSLLGMPAVVRTLKISPSFSFLNIQRLLGLCFEACCFSKKRTWCWLRPLVVPSAMWRVRLS